mmetsp:Transcript_64367/g.192225  ORF Transcript_64367/g.192225 Transcript_64367/m.192225 type:complete len:130 (-) Transcript_64367:81-470(-)
MTAYHNVSEVRTNDDTLITIKLMLFYDLIDIEKMLDATPDPIGDFINAASSDVIAFCSAVSYETFLNETHKLNDLATFAQLVGRCGWRALTATLIWTPPPLIPSPPLTPSPIPTAAAALQYQQQHRPQH